MEYIAVTTYKVTGTKKAVQNLWNALQELNVNNDEEVVFLSQLARYYGIDYRRTDYINTPSEYLRLRGYFIKAEYEEDDASGKYILTFETRTEWHAYTDFFDMINHLLNDELSISYRICKVEGELYLVHDEGNFFPEKVCVSSNGVPFGFVSSKVFNTLHDAIAEWSEKTGEEQGKSTDEFMEDYINHLGYDDDEAYYHIYHFIFK